MLNLPPMIPLSAWTSYVSSPQRAKICLYASRLCLEARAHALLVAVERVGVLHDELADPQEPAARPRLVAILVGKWYQSCGSSRYDWISRAWNVTVSSCVSGRMKSRPVRSFTLEDLRNRHAARRLPELGGSQDGHQHLLAADRVHLLADDLLDLPVDAPAERHERPDARAHLADEAAADEQLVAHRLGIGRIIAERRDEEL